MPPRRPLVSNIARAFVMARLAQGAVRKGVGMVRGAVSMARGQAPRRRQPSAKAARFANLSGQHESELAAEQQRREGQRKPGRDMRDIPREKAEMEREMWREKELGIRMPMIERKLIRGKKLFAEMDNREKNIMLKDLIDAAEHPELLEKHYAMFEKVADELMKELGGSENKAIKKAITDALAKLAMSGVERARLHMERIAKDKRAAFFYGAYAAQTAQQVMQQIMQRQMQQQQMAAQQ